MVSPGGLEVVLKEGVQGSLWAPPWENLQQLIPGARWVGVQGEGLLSTQTPSGEGR